MSAAGIVDMDMGPGGDGSCDVDVGGCYYHGTYVPTDAEVTAYQNSHPDPWASNIKYGYYGFYFLVAALGLAIAMNVFQKLVQYHRLSTTSPGKTGSLQAKMYAIVRWANYVRLPWSLQRFVAPVWTSGTFAQTLLLGVGFLYCTAYCFGITYYYRPPFYGSAPLGLRSEYLAMAMLPFLFMLAQKRNLIGTLTGTPYQKLQVLHQGVSGLHFYMSLVHTISMSIRGQRELGLNSHIYISGFAALVPLIWLCVASLPVFRTKAYEGFWVLHMSAVIAYLGTLWWHVYPELNSPNYMYATFAIFAWGFLLRVGWLIYRNLTLHKAEVSLSSTGAVLMSIRTRMRWGAGQHVFLRFFTVHPLESHPFSVASLPGAGDEHEMKFIVQPRDGLTKALANKAAGGSLTLNVFVDGPLGDCEDLRAYDSAMLFAGGSGISHVLPVFLDLVSCLRGEGGRRSRCARVELVWAVRTLDALKWFESDILAAIAGVSEDAVSVRVFVTAEPADISKADGSDDEKSSTKDEKAPSRIEIGQGRPQVRALIQKRTEEWTGRVALGTCGPLELVTDCSNAAAAAQLDILSGVAKCEEVHLASEIFAW